MTTNNYITTDCKVTVSKNTSKLDEEIYLYKNDKNIKLLFEIVDSKYKYKEDYSSNLLNKYKASYAQVKWYKNAEVKKEFPVQATDDGKVVFIIEKELIDEDTELGDYDLQIRLLNESQESIRSLPIIEYGVHIQKPLFESTDLATADYAAADISMLSLDGEEVPTYNADGTYNQTSWTSGKVIESNLLNKLEIVNKDNVDKIKELQDSGGSGSGHTHANKDVLDGISSSDIDNWNAKSDFGGSYDDLSGIPSSFNPSPHTHSKTDITDFPTIPTKTSDLTNDSSFATEGYVNNQIANASLSGAEVDLSSYQTKNDDNITGDDKNIVSNINNLNTQFEEIEQQFGCMISENATISEINEIIETSNVNILFPANKIYILDSQIKIYNKENININFNNCTFKLTNNASFSAITLENLTYQNTCFIIESNTNLKIENLNIDGNRNNNTVNWFTGITIRNTSMMSNNLYLANCNYHHIVIYDNSICNFYDTKFYNLGNLGGHSDVYTSTSDDIQTTFINTYSERPIIETETNTGQVFYFGGGYNVVENLISKNCYIALDQRTGSLKANNITTYGSKNLSFETYPATTNGNEPSITVTNMNCYDIKTQANDNTLIYVTVTKKLILKNIVLHISSDSSSFYSCIRIRKFYDYLDLSNVEFENIVFTGNCNPTGRGLIFQGITDKNIKLKDIYIEGSSAGSDIEVISCTGKVFLTNVYITNFTNGNIVNDVNNSIVCNKTVNTIGTTSNRPVLKSYDCSRYFDTDLNKEIIWNGSNWINLDGSNII